MSDSTSRGLYERGDDAALQQLARLVAPEREESDRLVVLLDRPSSVKSASIPVPTGGSTPTTLPKDCFVCVLCCFLTCFFALTADGLDLGTIRTWKHTIRQT